MFDGPDFPKPLEEELFDSWLEQGRAHKIQYVYLLILWDDFECKYLPAYAESRHAVNEYESYGNSTGQESIVALYDLYSESRIAFMR